MSHDIDLSRFRHDAAGRKVAYGQRGQFTHAPREYAI
jgi:hypothetical protein